LAVIDRATFRESGYWTAWGAYWTSGVPGTLLLNPAYDTGTGDMSSYHKDAGYRFELSQSCIPREASLRLGPVLYGPEVLGAPLGYDYWTDLQVHVQVPPTMSTLGVTSPTTLHDSYPTTGVGLDWVLLDTLELTQAPATGDVWEFDLDVALLLQNVIYSSDFDGTIILMLRCVPVDQSSHAGFQLPDLAGFRPQAFLTVDAETTPYTSKRTGLVGPDQAQSRADECPVCGFMSLRERWVKDGYRKRLVCPMCYDPPDKYEREIVIQPERPGLNEENT
jgi:hypothetical protein